MIIIVCSSSSSYISLVDDETRKGTMRGKDERFPKALWRKGFLLSKIKTL